MYDTSISVLQIVSDRSGTPRGNFCRTTWVRFCRWNLGLVNHDTGNYLLTVMNSAVHEIVGVRFAKPFAITYISATLDRRKTRLKQRMSGWKVTPVNTIFFGGRAWLRVDFGTITILYSQPVAALQILTKDGNWKWVRHIENALVNRIIVLPLILHWQVINSGDTMEFFSGGFYRPTIHR